MELSKLAAIYKAWKPLLLVPIQRFVVAPIQRQKLWPIYFLDALWICSPVDRNSAMNGSKKRATRTCTPTLYHSVVVIRLVFRHFCSVWKLCQVNEPQYTFAPIFFPCLFEIFLSKPLVKAIMDSSHSSSFYKQSSSLVWRTKAIFIYKHHGQVSICYIWT